MNGSTSTWTVTRSLSSTTTLSIAGLLDKQVPVRQVTCRRRPSTMWFDDDCRKAKRVMRSTESAARRTGPLSDNNLPAVAAWRIQRRQYFTLLQQKRSDFWTKRLDAEQSRPRRLWRSFDELLGRGQAPLSSDIDVSTLHCFFDDKVAGIRASTDGADSPTFTTVSVG